MSLRVPFRLSAVALGVSAALATSSLWAQDAPPPAAEEDAVEDMGVITVTGSRTITDVLLSPTPITSVDVSALAITTPSDTADALNKLPTIMGGRTPRNQGNGSTNNGGNTLSLRNFGPSRTLVMLDGHRVAPNNQDGSVNIDTLPQMLVKNVDIVTGGASAIYGSDAVAGVVNYMLDKNFTGLTFKSDYGKSKYGDGEEYQIGAAWGTSLFSDRGHFEASARFRHQDMIPIRDRPYGEDGQIWLLTGNGRPLDPAFPNDRPFENTPYSRVFNSGQAGNIQCGSACLYNNYTFNSDGSLRALVHGAPSASGNIESGGDGAYIKYGTFRSELDAKDVFARFSLDLTENTNWYVQGSWAEAENASDWIQWVVSPNNNRPNTIFADNPFLSDDTQQLLGASVVCPTVGWNCLPAVPPMSTATGIQPPAPPTTPFVRVPRYLNQFSGQAANDPNRLYRTLGDQKTWNAETGVTGELGGWNWDVYFNHGNSELTVTNPHNTDNAKYLAALDAVEVDGTIQCWVSTQPAYASLYPGCVPMNIVTPNGPSAEAYEYLRTETSWTLTQEINDVGASIGGGLWGLGLPAGEIRANLSAEARWQTYVMESKFLPTDFVDCTGLRMCLAGGANNNPVRWVQNVNAPVDVKNHVYEAALEFNVPLLKDVPGFQDLSANLAGRWTKYENFESVETWKLGLNWQIIDSLRFRGTLSSDIRAPNLNDLFQPAGLSSTSFTDRLTGGTAQGMRLLSGGNPNLIPEEAKTFTAGLVLTPSFMPRFSLSVDYYETRLTNAITGLNYAGDDVQAVCLASAPSYSSPVCLLADRPNNIPGSSGYDSPSNFPNFIRNAPANAALQKTHGYDLQLDYSTDIAGGQFAIRHLASYQLSNSTLTTPLSTFYTWAVQPKLIQTTFLSYRNTGWAVSVQNRWLSSVSRKTSDNALNGNRQNYVDASLDAFDVIDTTISKEFEVSNGNMEAFLTVNNVLNERAPLAPDASGLPGLFYPTLGIYDDMGRFFTAGVKIKF
jgi:outer membrane receptor protein involved in Fe transport